MADTNDNCPGSVPDGIALNPNQCASNDFSTLAFEVGPSQDQSIVYDMALTGGCTCRQIVAKLGAGNGHLKKGCSPSLMEQFTGVSSEPDRKAKIGKNRTRSSRWPSAPRSGKWSRCSLDLLSSRMAP